MPRSIFFRAKKNITGPEGQPVVIAGKRCRFLKGKAYEVPVQRQPELAKALEAMIAKGDCEKIGQEEGPELVEKQDEAIRAKRRKARVARALAQSKGEAVAPEPELAAKIEVGDVPK